MHRNIRLRKATLDDVPILTYWDEQPHVIISNPLDESDWEDDLSKVKDWEEILIAELDKKPIGVICIIDPEKEESTYWGKDAIPGYRAIDIWIGESSELGKGYGTEMMKQALERCFKHEDVQAVLIDPLVTNKDAIRFYERLGFVFVEERIFGKGDHCAVYKMTRDIFLKSSFA